MLNKQSTLIPRLFLLLALSLILSLPGQPAPVAAQSDGLSVLISQVDSTAFPQVEIFTTVTDSNGASVFGLTADNFQISEEGSRIPEENLTVESDNTQPLSVVLAVDTSMPQADLSNLQTAANQFIDALGVQDQLAILALYDTVDLVQDFTSDKNDLRQAINDLEPQGNLTALNEAVFDAIGRVSALPASRKSVFLFTNSADNTSTRSLEETLTRAQAQSIPVYAFGFSDNIENEVLQQMASVTGGQAYLLAGSNQIAANLQPLSLVLRQGYKLTFQSELTADNAEHPFTVQVNANGNRGEATGRFTAFGGEVSISLNLQDEATIGGLVTLTPDVSAPAPLSEVEYLLDGRSLEQVTSAPFSFEWDAADVSPGLYNLTAQATDTAGNQGQTAIEVRVVPAININLTASRETVNVGDTVTLQAEVDALNPILSVDFLVQNTLLQSDADSPYNLTLDTTDYRAGELNLTARARDSLGQTADASLSLTLEAVPTPNATGSASGESGSASGAGSGSNGTAADGSQGGLNLGRWLSLVLVLGAVIIAAPLLGALIIWQRRRNQTKFQLEVANDGNTRSRYVLRALNPENLLEFRFELQSQELPNRRVMITASDTNPAPPDEAMTEAQKSQFDYGDLDNYANQQDATGPQKGKGDKGGGNAMKNVTRFAEMGGIIGEVLYLIASFMPSGIRGPLQRVANRMRRVRTASQRVGRLSKKADKLRDEEEEAEEGEFEGNVPPPNSAVDGETLPPGTEVQVWSQTPYIEPGQSLRLEMFVKQTKLFQRKGEYPFKLLSKSLDMDDAPTKVNQALLQLTDLSWFRRLIWPVLSGVMLLGILALCMTFVLLLGGVITP